MKNKSELNFLRTQGREIFDKVRGDWINYGRWALPHRTRWLESRTEGQRANQHIVDTTHILALRSFTAGFLEGNTSASRPWYRYSTGEPSVDAEPANHAWLDIFNNRTLRALNNSNFYHAAGVFYYDYGVFNNGAQFMEELANNTLHYHTLTPGSYNVINNSLGEAVIMIREFSLRVKALVDGYGEKDKNGKVSWSNFSSRVKKMYDDSNYSQCIDVAQVIMQNDDFDPTLPIGGSNRQWMSYTWEAASLRGAHITSAVSSQLEPSDEAKFLKISYSKRKPFIVGRSDSSTNFEYGETGPTSNALGLIKSLNKKAIAKDRALEQMVNPAVQGPASLRKSYVTTAPGKYVPLDAASYNKNGLKRIFEISPAIGYLVQDTDELKKEVDRHYFADFLLYLTKNPKTRTATETNAILEEQQRVIGPNLQSLNWTFNNPHVDFVADYVLDNDPDLPPIPKGLQGRTLKPEFISVFAQAQNAADLPSIDRYIQAMMNLAQINPDILYKANIDKYADLYQNRLYLPEGLNRPQDEADKLKQQAMQARQKQQEMEALTQASQVAKNVGLKVNNSQGEEQ